MSRSRRRRRRRYSVTLPTQVLTVSDPLAVPAKKSRAASVGLFFGAVAAHAAVLATLFAASAIARHLSSPPPAEAAIAVSVIERAPPPPPPPPPAPPPTAKPPPPAPRRDPINVPKKIEATPPAEVKPVVGIDKASTVDNANAPAFAVGNTRMGETAKIAEPPAKVEALPPREPVIVAPKAKRSIEPIYPRRLHDQEIESEVVVRVTIDATGVPVECEIVTPSPYAEFNEAAKKAALSDLFSPATKDGEPFVYKLTRKYTFRITD